MFEFDFKRLLQTNYPHKLKLKFIPFICNYNFNIYLNESPKNTLTYLPFFSLVVTSALPLHYLNAANWPSFTGRNPDCHNPITPPPHSPAVLIPRSAVSTWVSWLPSQPPSTSIKSPPASSF